ncbi:MAG: hypothetical protein P1P86_16315 [Bacteroidales bacterium]|nr:hypothetical protein [Bacteroidales bacterium]
MCFLQKILSALAMAFLCLSLSNGQSTPWQNIGPYVGYINSMAMDMSHPDTLYAATPSGLYQSVNAAGNWTQLDLSVSEVEQVVVSQADPAHILCFTEYTLYQSIDYGIHWEPIWDDTVRIETAGYNPENPRTIVLGTDKRYTTAGWDYFAETPCFFRSSNGGDSWNEVHFTGAGISEMPNSVKQILIDPSDTLKIYVGTENSDGGGIYYSHNNGTDWANAGLFGTNEEVYALACTPAGYADHTLCAISYETDMFDRTLFISKNAGLSWEEQSPPSSFDLVSNVNYESTLFISDNMPDYVQVGMEYEYEDVTSSVAAYSISGDTWYYRVGAPHSFPTSILISGDADYLAFANKGIYQYMEATETWASRNHGILPAEILDMAGYPDSPGKMLVAIENNVYRTLDQGQSWQVLGETNTSRNSVFIKHGDPDKLFAGTKQSAYIPQGSSYYIYKSENGGDSWDGQSLFTNWSMYDAKWWSTEITGPTDHPDVIFIGIDGAGLSYDGFYKTENGGGSWSHKSHTGVSAIAMDPVDQEIVYQGTSNLGYVLRSEDAGDTWERISPGGDYSFAGTVRDLAVDSEHQVFAATSSGLSQWEGDTVWTLVGSFPSLQTNALAFDNFQESPVYYVGTEDQGVYLSKDGGTTWSSYNQGLERRNIDRLEINQASPGSLYAGTRNGGVWITGLAEVNTSHWHSCHKGKRICWFIPIQVQAVSIFAPAMIQACRARSGSPVSWARWFMPIRRWKSRPDKATPSAWIKSPRVAIF